MKKAIIYLQTIIMFMMVAFSTLSFADFTPDNICPSGYNFQNPITVVYRLNSCSASNKYPDGGQVGCIANQPCSGSTRYIRIKAPYATCPANSSSTGDYTCSCNTGFIQNSENNQCLLDENNNGIPDDDEANCEEDNSKRLTVSCPNNESCLQSVVCHDSCEYRLDPENIDTKYYTQPSSANPNQVYSTNNYLGNGGACEPTASEPQQPEQPNELDCSSVGMVNNATNDGCISPESPECPENYVDTLTEDGCQPMTCPVCTFWSEVGGSTGGGGCIQNDACHEPILDNDNDGIPNKTDPDIDGDGVPNGSDPDVDGDGVPNSRDPDIDGDGIANGNDTDIDGDGQSNSVDSDKDGDGIPNEEDEQDGGEGEAGDCEAEPEKCELLTNIKDSLEVDEETQAKINDLENGLGGDFDTVEDDAIFEISAMFDTFVEDNALLNAYRDLLPTSPWDDFFNADQSCTIETSMQGHEMNFSICQYQPTIRPILGWMMFVITFFAIFALIFERPQT